MKLKLIPVAACAALSLLIPLSAQDAAHAVAGVVKHIDHATKTAVVKTADGAEHTLDVAGKDAWKGLKDGTEVVVHYTEAGAAGKKTAMEVHKIERKTMREGEGTVASVEKTGKYIRVRFADGVERAVLLTKDTLIDSGVEVGHGAKDAGKLIGNTEHISVLYTEKGGKRIAHLIRMAA